MTVLVLGGYGAVGKHIVDALRVEGVDTAAVGRDPRRADVTLDLSDHDAVADVFGGAQVVVNASGSEDLAVARLSAERGIPFVDISATSTYTQELERVSGPVLLGVGIAPGLSGLLAREVFSAATTELDVAIGLGAGEKHGTAATEWTYGLLGRKFDDPDGSSVLNFTRRKSIDFPREAGYRSFPSLRADFADQHRLTAELGVPVRTYLRLDSPVMTAGLAVLTRVPRLAALSPSVMPGGDRWAIVARDAEGRAAWATGRLQSVATAVIAAWAAKAVVDKRIELSGPAWLHGIATLADLRGTLATAGITTT